ncbi:MAG: transglutaminase family protein [Planctomycetota bacterium]
MRNSLNAALVFLALLAPGTLDTLAHGAAQLSLRPASNRPAVGQLKLATEHWISASGSVRTEVTATFSILEFAAYRAAIEGDSRRVARGLLPGSTTRIEEAAPSVRYDDERGAIVFERSELGAVRWGADGARTFNVEEGLELVEVTEANGRAVAQFRERGALFGLAYEGDQRVIAPSGATDVTFDKATHSVSWRPASAAVAATAAKVVVSLTPTERLLTGAYKAYGFGGEHWVGRVRIDNSGPGAIQRFALRHRVEGYSEWSPWTKLSDVAAGESAVLCLYPILAASTAALRSDTPANLLVEWRYIDGDGAAHEDAEGARIVLLGGNDFIFARSARSSDAATFEEQHDNVDLLAAWVSRDDSIVREVAALGAKRAGGAPANQDLFSAVATLKGLYEALVANDITYQHPPALVDSTLSFNSNMVQNIKYPRDVLRDRSGTCIDLAVLYASLVHAAGLPAYLCVVPGHCFPVIGMPDGTLAAVEVTGVGGGGRMGSDAETFGRVFLYGQQELAEALAGPHALLDLRHQWTHGVSCPELPPLAADAVAKTPLRELIPPTKVPHLAALREDQMEWFNGSFELLLTAPGGVPKVAALRSVPCVDARTFLVVLTERELELDDNGDATRRTTTQLFEGRPLFNTLRCAGLCKWVVVESNGVEGEATRLPPDSFEVTHWEAGFEGELLRTNPDGGEPVVVKIQERKQ